MTDAKKASKLISKSLRREAAAEDKEQIAEHLSENEKSRKFAEISELIQDSVAQAAVRASSDDESLGPGLSDDSKQKLKESISHASKEKLRLSQAGLISTSSGKSSLRGTTLDRSLPKRDVRKVISQFKLLRRLGEGGFGHVWLARDEAINRTVAIKEMREEALESPKAWQRFRREAEVTGLLEHPNIISLYQFGDDAVTGEPFYAMRFVGKRNLAEAIIEHYDRIEEGGDAQLGLHRLLTVFLDVCQAIAYAHSRGVIHRDLKPENIALDSFGQVIVLDWGLAKLVEDGELAHQLTSQANIGDSSLTRTIVGDVVGTPLYMAPEQAAGDLDSIDDKTDVYGLGAILFAILTASAPHEKSGVGDSHAPLVDALNTIVESETPRPSDYRPGIPIELESICRKAMAKKRHLRYDSVESLADAVERWMAGQNKKHALYEGLRMEGRELRADLQACVHDLKRNATFMSNLPPIQQLIGAESDASAEESAVWRERLATIFHGLLEANPDYTSVVYNRVEGNEFSELVRVERHSDSRRVRNVPRSRLRTEEANEFITSLISQKPDEVVSSIVSDPMCDRDPNSQTLGLVAGVPVYDNEKEAPFGVVMIVCDIERVLRNQVNRRLGADELMIVSDTQEVVLHYSSGHTVDENRGESLTAAGPHFLPAAEGLESKLEYIDETNADTYGARIWFIPNQHGLMYLLRLKIEK